TNAAVGTTLSLLNTWLVRNDTDPNGDALNIGSASKGANVEQVTAGPASTSIRTNVAAGGTGNFNYTATDGALTSAPATVSVSRGPTDNAITAGAGNDILLDSRTDQAVTTLDGGAGSDVVVGGSTTNTIIGDQ